MMDATPVALLIAGITATAAVVTSLALYIKKITKEHQCAMEALHKENASRQDEMYEKNLQMSNRFIDAINKTTFIGDHLSGSIDRNTATINDLHRVMSDLVKQNQK